MSVDGVSGEERTDYTREESRIIRRRSANLLREVLRPSGRRLAWSIALIVLGTMAQVAGPALIAIGIDTGIPAAQAGDWHVIVWVSIGFFASALFSASAVYGYVRGFTAVGQNAMLDLRTRLYRHTQRLSLEFHESYTSGRIIARQTSDLDSIREFLGESLNSVIAGLLFMIFTAGALLLVDGPSGLVLLAALIPISFIVNWYQKRSERVFRASRVASARLIVKFVETMTGMRAVQAFRAEERNQERFNELNRTYVGFNNQSMRLFGIFAPSLNIVAAFTLAVVLLLGGFRVLQDGMEIGVLLAVLLYVRQFFQPIDEVAAFYNGYQSASAALEKISGVLAEDPSVPEPTRPVPLPQATGAVRFDRVVFEYLSGRTVLPEFTLDVPAGQTIALVGATGAGKTTLAKLLARFYDPSHGEVQLDGVSLRKISGEDLRRAIVMVTQDAYLFSGSVAENIALGKPGASRDEIIAAATAVGAHEFITALPEGYDTDVNKRGGRVSAGQRQLISFARAFIADPAVLILDEATSSLDIPSERLVQHALQTLLADRTALIIAHRLSTVAIADRVLVMDAGHIVEDGTPEQLIAGTGRFAALHAAWRDSLV
ncbi:MAG TPA: ABC transporter ATP-binding protein [Microbacteriaceae bacterium]|nr:ABC transporter ATP-binding protein [Microbacteriaceae bacterium]